ncbi:MAG: hypothetical protein QW794_08465 [Thermosphaera sp.]
MAWREHKLPKKYVEEEEEVETETGKIQLRAELDPELAEKLRYIKKLLGIRKNSEAIRYLIIRKYEELVMRSGERVEV